MSAGEVDRVRFCPALRLFSGPVVVVRLLFPDEAWASVHARDLAAHQLGEGPHVMATVTEAWLRREGGRR